MQITDVGTVVHCVSAKIVRSADGRTHAGVPGRRENKQKRRVRREGLEPPTHALEGHCSIQLSYRRRGLEPQRKVPHNLHSCFCSIRERAFTRQVLSKKKRVT